MKRRPFITVLITILATAPSFGKESACLEAVHLVTNPRPLNGTASRHEIFPPDRGRRKIQLPPNSVLLAPRPSHTLAEYLQSFNNQTDALELIGVIENLKSYDRVADFSGNLEALEELLNLQSKVYGFANIYKPGTVPDIQNSKLTVINRQFERLKPNEVPEYELGLDFQGAFSRTTHLDYYMKVAINRLQVGGKFFIQADFSKLQIKKNPVAYEKKYGFTHSEMHLMTFKEWMATCEGISYRFSDDYKTLVITRISDKPFIVSTMDLVSYKENADGLPTRVFQEVR